MRIAYITVRFPAPSETFACLDVLTLARGGDEVYVFAMRGPHPDHARLVEERGLSSVPVEPATTATRMRGLCEAARRPLLALRLLAFVAATTWRRPSHLAAALALVPSAMYCHRRIHEIDPDVVHLFWGHFPALVGFLTARTRPETVLSHFLGAYDLEYGFGPTAPVARCADAVWTHAAVNIPRIEALGVTRRTIRVAHRGIDTGATAAPLEARGPRVVAAGRLIDVKRFDDAIRVLAAVRERVGGATLTIAGDGPARARLEALARALGVDDAVRFEGHLPQQALFAHFQRGAVLLLMSQSPSERLPNVAKEAALRGCVTVTTDSTGIDELFTDGVDACIVPAGDVSAAADRVVGLLEDPTRRAQMARAAGQRVRDAFDVEATMAVYRERWRQLRAG